MGGFRVALRTRPSSVASHASADSTLYRRRAPGIDGVGCIRRRSHACTDDTVDDLPSCRAAPRSPKVGSQAGEGKWARGGGGGGGCNHERLELDDQRRRAP